MFVFFFLCLLSFILQFNVNNMCTRPIKIQNPKIKALSGFNPRFDKEFITVPCNKCPECVSAKHNEWLSRAWYEHKSCQKAGGKTCFLTFTYNDDYLPYFDGVPVFDSHDLELFFKNFRRQLKIAYGHNVNFRYLVTSEYGKEKCRPHYHILFFFYENVADDDVFRLAWCSWSPYPSECKPIYNAYGTDITKYYKLDYDSGELIPLHRGIVQVGKDRDGVPSLQVHNISGIYYCTKYILKDNDWLKMRNRLFCKYVKIRFPNMLDEHIVLGSDTVKNNPCLYVLQKDFLKNIKRFDLFHRQSMGFGSSIIDICNQSYLDDDKVLVPDPTDLEQNKTVPTPLYIQRKLFYDSVKHYKGLKLVLSKRKCKDGFNYNLVVQKDYYISYVLSHKGALHRVQTFDSMIDRKIVKYYKLRALNPTPEFMKLYFPSETVASIWDKFDTVLHNRPLKHLFEYETIFKDRFIVNFYDMKQAGFLTSPYQKPKFHFLLFNEPQLKQLKWKVSNVKYNDHPLFKDFDYCLDVLSKFKKLESWYFHSQCIETYNKRQKVDSAFGKYVLPRLKPIPNILNF